MTRISKTPRAPSGHPNYRDSDEEIPHYGNAPPPDEETDPTEGFDDIKPLSRGEKIWLCVGYSFLLLLMMSIVL